MIVTYYCTVLFTALLPFLYIADFIILLVQTLIFVLSQVPKIELKSVFQIILFGRGVGTDFVYGKHIHLLLFRLLV
jgi:hypothetical protein